MNHRDFFDAVAAIEGWGPKEAYQMESDEKQFQDWSNRRLNGPLPGMTDELRADLIADCKDSED